MYRRQMASAEILFLESVFESMPQAIIVAVSKGISTPIGMLQFDMFWYVLICFDMFWYVLICFDMFWYVLICFDMFWYVLIWFDMLKFNIFLGLISFIVSIAKILITCVDAAEKYFKLRLAEAQRDISIKKQL